MSKIGRHDPCPCGSRKKYKRCCGGMQPITALPNLEEVLAPDPEMEQVVSDIAGSLVARYLS